VRETPPRHGGDGGVLRPGEQQQQSEHCLDIDGDKKQRIDVEIHRVAPIFVRAAVDRLKTLAVTGISQTPEKTVNSDGRLRVPNRRGFADLSRAREIWSNGGRALFPRG
jgi:hypothetical protein